MSQSVKLSDGSYIDAGAVWDATQGKTIEELNNSAPIAYLGGVKTLSSTANTWVYDDANAVSLPAGLWLLILTWYSDSQAYMDAGVYWGDHGGVLLGLSGAMPSGAMRSRQVIGVTGVSNDKSVVVGFYADATGAAMTYELEYVKLR